MKWIAATDLSPRSNGVFEFAAWLRQQLSPTDAEAFSAITVARDADFFTATPEIREQIAERLGVVLADIVADSPARDTFSRTRVLTASSVAGALCRCAGETDAILLLGRLAERDSARVIRLGPIARRVIRRLPAPVVVVPPDWRREHAGGGPILVAVDPTEPSLAAIAFGTALASSLGRPVAAAHVLPGAEDLGIPFLASSHAAELLEAHTRSARQQLRAFVDQHDLADLPMHTTEARTVEGLVNLAAKSDAPIIVCGSRMLAIGERLFSASVGSELAATAAIPVAIVPPDYKG